MVNAMISRAFPDDLIVGEEDSGALSSNPGLLSKVVDLTNSVFTEKLSAEQILSFIDKGCHKGGAGRWYILDALSS